MTEEKYFSGTKVTIGNPKEQFKKSQKFKVPFFKGKLISTDMP